MAARSDVASQDGNYDDGISDQNPHSREPDFVAEFVFQTSAPVRPAKRTRGGISVAKAADAGESQSLCQGLCRNDLQNAGAHRCNSGRPIGAASAVAVRTEIEKLK